MPRNKFTLFALLWAAATVYALLRRDLGASPLPVADMLSISCAALVFGQSVLFGKAFFHENKPIPTLLIPGASAAWTVSWRLAREYAFDLPSENLISNLAAVILSASAASVLLRLQTAKN